jgi:hypothetical protein
LKIKKKKTTRARTRTHNTPKKIQIPATEAGIEAAASLQREDRINVNLTSVSGVMHAAACAQAGAVAVTLPIAKVCLSFPFFFPFFSLTSFLGCTERRRRNKKFLLPSLNPPFTLIVFFFLFVVFRYANGAGASDGTSLDLKKRQTPGRRRGWKKTRRRSPRTLNYMVSPRRRASSPAT